MKKMIKNFLLLGLLLGFSGCTKSCKREAELQEEHKEDVKEEKKEDKEHAARSVHFVAPQHEQKLSSPVHVKFAVNGMKVRPALEDVNDKSSGHFHLLIDHPQGFIEAGQVIPADEKQIHYGNGETEADITLAPGTHTLSLQFSDGAHLSYGKEMAKTITITVE